MGTWILHPKAKLPAGTKILKNTWAFLIKRLPDGTIRKFKSRLAVRGDMQEQGTHYGGTGHKSITFPDNSVEKLLDKCDSIVDFN